MKNTILSVLTAGLFIVSSTVNADAAQSIAPDSAKPSNSGTQAPATEITPGNIKQNNLDPATTLHKGGVGPNTIPSNVNQNGTVDTAPAEIK